MSGIVRYNTTMLPKNSAIHQTYHTDAPIEKVWDALVNPKTIESWGGGPARMSNKLESFSLWDGEIHGRNTEVVEGKKLVQEWYAWDESLGASTVTFTITVDGKETVIDLSHSNVPESEYEEVEVGWKNYYMEPILEWIENDDH